MTIEVETEKCQPEANIKQENQLETEKEKILCFHCQRTATNGIKCKGICVADSDY